MSFTIEEITEQLSVWRQNKAHRSEAIPKEIWQNINELLKTTAANVIGKKLNLTKEQLTSKCSYMPHNQRYKQNHKLINTDCDDGFLKVPAINMAQLYDNHTVAQQSFCEISLMHADASVQIKVNTTALACALQQIRLGWA